MRGTNATLTGADFSTTEYSNTHGIRDGRLWFQIKSAAELNALASPPPSPFTVTAAVTMTNDEGQTATGTLTFRTSYARDTTEKVVPTLAPAEARTVGAGGFASVGAYDVFDNAGTNARFTGVEFSTMEYYDGEFSGIAPHGKLWVQVKSAAELNALASPPPSPFTVTAAVTMTNDEGQTATGTLTFKTMYNRKSPAHAGAQVGDVGVVVAAVPGVALDDPADGDRSDFRVVQRTQQLRRIKRT